MLTLTLGITLILGGIIKQVFDVYYEKSILPRRSIIEQNKCKKVQNKMSQMGAHDIPFRNGKLISKLHDIHEFNSAVVICGFFILLILFIEFVTTIRI